MKWKFDHLTNLQNYAFDEVLGAQFPHFQELLEGFGNRIIDIKGPSTEGMIYSHAMGNSYSIKNVYLAMVPENKNAYKDLDTFKNGTDAMKAFEEIPLLSVSDRLKTSKELLEYCKLDKRSMYDTIKHISINL